MRSRQNFTGYSNATGLMSFRLPSATHVLWGGGSIARRWIFVGGGSSKAILDGATARSQLSEVAAKRNGVSLLLARDNQRQPLMVIAARVLNLSIGQTIKFLADGDTRFLDGLHEAVGTTYLRPIP